MDYPDGIAEGDRPVPWPLQVVYVVIVLWCLWYLGASLSRHGVHAVTPVEEQVGV